MERKVKICTLYAGKAQGAADCLERRLADCSVAAESEDFGDAAAFAARAADLAADGGIVVAAAPLDAFLNAKYRLLKSLSCKIVRSSQVDSLIKDNPSLTPKERDLHSAVPSKAKVFVTQDGFYSAFAVKDGESTVIFLPLDGKILNYLFSSQIGAFFSEMLAVSAPKTKKQELTERVEGVVASGKTVAVAPCGSSKMLLSAISSVSGSELAFVPDSVQSERAEGESEAEYIARCAKESKENSNTDLGIAISRVHSDDSGELVVVCVADSDRAKAAKVYAKPGEDSKMLIVAAIIKLCRMLEKHSDPMGMVNPDLQAKPSKKWSKNSKTPLIVAIIGIAAAIVVCLILAFVMAGKQDNAAATYGEQNGMLQEETLVDEGNFDYQGGSALDFADIGAIEIEDETSTYSFISTNPATTLVRTTAPKTTIRQTTTKVITTVAKTLASTTKLTTVATTVATTAKPTTTAAPTTTTTTTATTTAAPTTTQAAVTETKTTSSKSGEGTFVFRVYGYGHGVGMSQQGAMQMAKDGKTYDEILPHYFAGATVKTDSSTPATIKYGGKDIPIVEYLCRTAKPEIGPSAPLEALKAQVVSAYTYAKYYNFDVAKSKHVYDSDYAYEGTNVHKACLAVLGMASDSDTPAAKYVDYNGKAAFTCYFASAAGKTASASSVWGGEGYPYLNGGVSSPEKVDASTKEFTVDEMRKYIEDYGDGKITLGDDPSEWIEIISHDSAYNANTGYVTKIRVGNHTMNGNAFRASIMDYDIRSHCFTVEYIPAE